MAVKLTFKQTTQQHIEAVVADMRDEDVAEVEAMGHTPLEALETGLRESDACVTAISPDGKPLVIYGVVCGNRLTRMGRPWMLGTNEALKYKRNFLVDTAKVIEKMLTMYPRLENYVHVKNRISVRWLKLLGFEMDEPQKVKSGEEFMRFYMRASTDV